MLVVENLDRAAFERAGALVAREHAAARQVRPELPAAFDSAEVCAAALQRLSGSGHQGLAADDSGRTRLPAEGVAVDPDLADPTGVLGVVFGVLAAPLMAGGVRRYVLVHAALPRLGEAVSNLGFGRYGACGIQPVVPRRRSSAMAVHAARAGHLQTIVRLALAEIQYPCAPPMFAPRQDRPLVGLTAEHRALHEGGAVHLLTTVDGRDVGLLTVELTSPARSRAPTASPASAPPPPCPARARRRARVRRRRAHLGL